MVALRKLTEKACLVNGFRKASNCEGVQSTRMSLHNSIKAETAKKYDYVRQNHRTAHVGRDFERSPGPTFCEKGNLDTIF